MRECGCRCEAGRCAAAVALVCAQGMCDLHATLLCDLSSLRVLYQCGSLLVCKEIAGVLWSVLFVVYSSTADWQAIGLKHNVVWKTVQS